MIIVYVDVTCGGSFSDLKIVDPNCHGIFRTRLLVAVFPHISSMFRLIKTAFGSLLQWYKSVKAIPEKVVDKGFTNVFKEVRSKVCADPKCKFVTEVIYS